MMFKSPCMKEKLKHKKQYAETFRSDVNKRGTQCLDRMGGER